MIVSCPACSGKVRLDEQRFRGKKVALRCPRCRHPFQVGVAESRPGSPSPRVLVAHADPAVRESICAILAREGAEGLPAGSGQEVLRSMAASCPEVILIDVALNGVMAFDLIDRLRSEPAWRSVKIILLSSVYNRTAYKRSPSSLYGADDYIEKHHLADNLMTKIRRLVKPGDDSRSPLPSGPKAAGQPSAFAQAVNSTLRQAEEAAAGPPADDPEKARRLARIIVADIALYNQDRVEEGLRRGNLNELLAGEIEEGRRLFASRVPEAIRNREDYLQQALDAFLAQRRIELRQAATGITR